MPISVNSSQFIADARIGATDAELDLATRRLAYAEAAITQYLGTSYATAPDAVLNEAASRLAAYQYDSPTVSGGAGFANALRNSGATNILLPYRVHGLGYADTVDATNAAIGSTANPVTGLAISGDVLTVTFADGTTDDLTLPDGSGAMFTGVDQTARDAASAAQSTADGNTGLITALNTEVDGLGTTRLQTNDIQAGDGIAVEVIDDPTNGAGVRITNTMVPAGPTTLTGWRFRYGTTPSAGQVAYEGAAGVAQVDNWRFGASGGFEDARAPLLALRSGDTILIRANASRHQTITLTATPTLAGVRVLVMGTADRGRSAELPLNNGSVTITLTPAPSGGGDGTDQTARNAAATAQAEIDAHELATHNTDATARAAAATTQTEIDNHEASTHNTDTAARTGAANAQTFAQDHAASTHNTDGTARAAANAAQTAADGKIDADAANALIAAHTHQPDATRYAASLALLTDIAAGDWVSYTSGLDAGELFKNGAFTVVTTAGRDKLVAPVDGVYVVKGNIAGNIDLGNSTHRGWLATRLIRTRGGVETAMAPEGTTGYARNQLGAAAQYMSSAVDGFFELQANDQIHLEGRFTSQNATNLFDLTSGYLGLVKF